MMKKKILSILLAAQTVMSIFGGICASAEEKTYQTMVDLTPYFNAKCYLSEANANTMDSASKPDWFLDASSGAGSTVAINKDKLSSYVNDGVLTHNGTGYLMPMPENAPGGITPTWRNVNIEANYYSKIKFLTFTDNTSREKIYGLINDTNFVHIFTYPRKGTTESAAELVVDAGILSPLKNQTVDGSGNIYETTVDIDASKKLTKVGFGNGGDSIGLRGRILAMTLIQKDSDVKKYIDEQVAEVLAQDAPTVDTVLKVKNYMDEKAEQGFNLDTVTGIDDFRILEKKFVSVKNYSDTTDFESIKLNINFSTAITESSVTKDNFKVTSNGEDKAFTIEAVKTDDKITGVALTMDNQLNYADKIKVVVSKNIKNAEDEKFNLGSDKTIEFVPKAPTVYIKSLKKTTSGENTVITGEIKNNSGEEQTYVLILGVYSKDNEMTSRAVVSGTISAGGKADINETLTFKGDVAEGTLLTDLSSLRILNCVTVE